MHSLPRPHPALIWVGVVAIMASIFSLRSASPAMLVDTDTVAILRGIESRENPWSWFVTDWPLENRFYRPLPTLSFALDLHLWGRNAAAFGATNAALMALIAGLIAWLATEVTGRAEYGLGASAVFGTWCLGQPLPLWWPAMLAGGVWLWRQGRATEWWSLGLLWVLAGELTPIQDLRSHCIAWLPGRTASVMAVFALAALACWVRGLRLDSPAWKCAALALTTAALSSYEQAIMLPVLLALLIPIQRRWRPSDYGWLAGLVAIGVAYLALRAAILPPEVSGYQSQQLRFGPGVLISLGDYVTRALRGLIPTYAALSIGPEALLLPTLYVTAFDLALTALAAAGLVQRRLWTPLAWLALSFLAFLPMAFLHPFGHYHCWPLALRAVAWVLLLKAWSSPPTPSAPQ